MEITGIYKYQNKSYVVLGIAVDSDTREEFVLCRPLNGNHWLIPRDTFFGTCNKVGSDYEGILYKFLQRKDIFKLIIKNSENEKCYHIIDCDTWDGIVFLVKAIV